MRCLVCKRKVADGQKVVVVSRYSRNPRRGDAVYQGPSNAAEFICLNCIIRNDRVCNTHEGK